jgi:hypothetical protein
MASYREDYQRPAAFLTRLTVAADPRVVDKLQVWPSAINPHPSPNANTIRIRQSPDSRLPWAYQSLRANLIPSQSYPDSFGHIHGSVQIRPAEKKSEAYLTYAHPRVQQAFNLGQLLDRRVDR